MSDSRKEGNTKMDPYWDSTSINLLNAIISMTLITTEHATMDDVLRNIDKLHLRSNGDSIQTSLDDLFDPICKKAPSSFCATNWKVLSELVLCNV
jgi:hypothetical protein